ncbi:cytochrome P450 [Ophiobolus disseminans]|uniref:Cytochrome P450 n=1 Tax=Ophiobolus disseminans TaxID=1469910 RepID=A0A6A7AL98_9PLEO|nr:cytochrome P450 [Ophiobolus disseminans]
MRVVLGKMGWVLGRDKGFWESCNIIKEFKRRHVDRALRLRDRGIEDEKRRCILVYELANETTDREELTSQLLNVFFAGRDTPAVALTNLFWLLARHPDVWRKCGEEVRALKKEDLGFEMVKGLRLTLKALRFLPPVPTQARTCLQSTTLPIGGGPAGTQPISVQRGDTISMPFFSLHRSSQQFPGPEVFRP